MVMIFKDTYEDLTPERLGEIIDAFEAGKGASIPVGPQVARTVSAPQSGLTTLRDERAVLKSTREEEDRLATQKAAAAEADAEAAAAAAAPPSNAAKPKTDAIETSVAVQSPSPVKVSAPAERATSVAPPRFDAANANKASEQVETTDKQRSSAPAAAEPAGAPKADEPAVQGAASTKPAAAVKPSLDDPNRPAAVEKPEKPDDLKLISGIGPKIEGILHSLGIFTFAQIAAWHQGERDWVDRYLNFKGRIDRDNWVRQADALAKGGVEEYVRVFGKDPR
jgi:NADH-quinone oxidoreductase subunit E